MDWIGNKLFGFHYCCMLLAEFIENIVPNWECNLMAEEHRCAPPCRWATGAARENGHAGDNPQGWPCYSFVLVLLCCLPSPSPTPTSNALSPFAPRRRKQEQSAGRSPHSDIFMYVVLTRLNSPSERLMRRNGLVEEPTGCIHSCHHHLNPGLLNLHIWPPTWMGNDLSALAWHPLRLRRNHSSAVRGNTSPLNPVSTGRWALL